MYAMVFRVTLFQPSQHQAGCYIIRLIDLNHLEAALKSGITLKILFVLTPSSRRDGTQFTTRQCRFQ
ncbi:hypothetical protein D3C84_1231630 [compost metagenome]